MEKFFIPPDPDVQGHGDREWTLTLTVPEPPAALSFIIGLIKKQDNEFANTTAEPLKFSQSSILCINPADNCISMKLSVLLNKNFQFLKSSYLMYCLGRAELGHFFLNLPIWANFVDPTDLSLYYYYLLLLPTTLEQTSSIGWTQPHPQPQPGLAKQHWLRLRLRLRPSLLDWAG